MCVHVVIIIATVIIITIIIMQGRIVTLEESERLQSGAGQSSEQGG